MRFLLDSCVWGPAAAALREAGHDVVHAGDWPRDPGDTAILDAARADARILFTLDKDFGELAVAAGRSHCGIIRLNGMPTRKQAEQAAAAATRHADELAAGAIVTVMPARMRVRLAERR